MTQDDKPLNGIFVYKAQPISSAPEDEIEGISIDINTTLPETDFSDANWETISKGRFSEQAKLLADALFDALPGGTIDSLLIEMLERKRCLLNTPFLHGSKPIPKG